MRVYLSKREAIPNDPSVRLRDALENGFSEMLCCSQVLLRLGKHRHSAEV